LPKKTAKDFKGVDIREVWDWRLSVGAPILFNQGEFWVVKVFANQSLDGQCSLLAEHTTKIKTIDDQGQRDAYDPAGVCACYAWLHSVRDKYKRPDFEQLLEPVAAINRENRRLAEANK